MGKWADALALKAASFIPIDSSAVLVPVFSHVSILILIKKDTACKPSSEFSSRSFTACQKEFIKLSAQAGANTGDGEISAALINLLFLRRGGGTRCFQREKGK